MFSPPCPSHVFHTSQRRNLWIKDMLYGLFIKSLAGPIQSFHFILCGSYINLLNIKSVCVKRVCRDLEPKFYLFEIHFWTNN